MVKSYTGVRKAPEKETQQILVKDFMTTRLILFKPEQSVGEVVKVLIEKNISGGPVVDSIGNLVGIISEGDCLKELVKGKYLNSPRDHGLVADHMVKEVKTISPNVNILDAANMFLTEKVRRFPVMEGGKLLGQISQRDVLRAVDGLKVETW